jgi:hypothetical protein
MHTALAPSWDLTTDHAASSHGQPVLLNRETGKVYGPGDILKAYPTWDFLSAVAVVDRLLKGKALDADTETMVTRFVGGVGPGKR